MKKFYLFYFLLMLCYTLLCVPVNTRWIWLFCSISIGFYTIFNYIEYFSAKLWAIPKYKAQIVERDIKKAFEKAAAMGVFVGIKKEINEDPSNPTYIIFKPEHLTLMYDKIIDGNPVVYGYDIGE